MSVAMEQAQAKYDETVRIFATGVPVHVRSKQLASAPMIKVDCLGTTKEAPCIITVLWSTDAKAQFGVPEAAEQYTCYTLLAGVLYAVNGEVLEASAGTTPRVRMKVDGNCLALPLRKHERYAVLASMEVSDLRGDKSYTKTVPKPLDISLGGFGLEITDLSWSVSEQVCFAFEIFVADGNVANRGLPSVKMKGIAVIRSVLRTKEPSKVRLGCQFSGMSTVQLEALEFWQTVHAAYLRMA